VRQHHGAPHHLVGVLGIHAKPQRELDGLVELGEFDFLHERDGVLERVAPVVGHLCPRRLVLFTVPAHDYLCGSIGPPRRPPTFVILESLQTSDFRLQTSDFRLTE
jgi:hypothetical protein